MCVLVCLFLFVFFCFLNWLRYGEIKFIYIYIMVKLDFANAFNSLHRSDMLLSVRDRLPELYAFLPLIVLTTIILVHYFGSHVILSQEGPQQGYPLGPLLFCSTIHPLITSQSSDLTLGYLDDLTVADPQSVVAADIQRVMAEGSKMGLCLNPSKCEVISHPDSNIVDQTMSSFTFVNVADATLLGAPLFSGKVFDDTWLPCCEDLKRAVERFSVLSAQDTLLRCGFLSVPQGSTSFAVLALSGQPYP